MLACQIDACVIVIAIFTPSLFSLHRLTFTTLGIIGQPKSNYDSKTLKFIVKEENEVGGSSNVDSSTEIPNAQDTADDDDGIIDDDNTDFDSDLF